MNKTLLTLGVVSGMALSASAQVYINELTVNVPGGDTGNEMFELRGTPNMSLAGYYLISLEGQGPTSTPGRGDVNQYLDLSSYSLGANGFLVGRQFGSPYGAINPQATLLESPTGPGWVQSGVYFTDGTGSDMENSVTTILLVNIGVGAAPTLTLDMDADNDGFLELPTGWTVADSVGLMDSVGAVAEDATYGAINFRVGTLGDSAYGNVIQLPGGTSTSLYVARIGDSTGSTINDWMAAKMSGTAPNFTFTDSTLPDYNGLGLPDMNFGGPNPVPEPTALSLLGLGLVGFLLRRKA